LTDGIYCFGPTEGESQLESIKNTIKYGVNDVTNPKTREAEMPAFGGRLSEDDIKKLAVYVHKFGGGQ
ncbi:MAG: cytochrome-c oxidase, cbb3-type subunit III, partial [Candidatus Thiodiazotropha sp. (ex Lucinoma borealis)]|nr:cytochrome-c oxidase, cbb3-type subunit III [Candidatus Thiodiazotropha sp. (ex Lucinoma borealis)]